MRHLAIAILLTIMPTPLGASEPIRVLIVGTYHFSNPGKDQANVRAVDITTPQRQREIQAISDSLAEFQPTFVGVEWPADDASMEYARYVEGSLPPSTNEVVQLGFRLAKQRGLKVVHGLDVSGDFPFQAVSAWAQANDKADELAALIGEAEAITRRITALQEEMSIGGVLREMNTRKSIDESASFYAEFLRYGQGDDQPGVALNTAWAKRNFAICANLLQQLSAGDRAVVFYGQGHVDQLADCVEAAPGVVLIDAEDYLPER